MMEGLTWYGKACLRLLQEGMHGLGAGQMVANLLAIAAMHPDLGFGVEQPDTTVHGMSRRTHGHCRAVDSQGSGCSWEGSGKANAPKGHVRLRQRRP